MEIRVDPPHLSVRMDFARSAIDTVELAIRPWAGIDRFGDGITDFVVVTGADTASVVRGDAGSWRFATGGRAFRVRYRVENEKTSFVGTERGDQFLPTLLDDLVFAWGHAYVMRPVDPRLRQRPVHARVIGAAHTSWDPARPLDGIDDLAETLLVAGSLDERRFVVEGADVTIVSHGTSWRAPPGTFADMVTGIVSAQVEYMGSYPTDRLLVALAEGTPHSRGGTAIKNAIAVFADPSGPLDAPTTLALIAHEHFHLWNGRVINRDEARGEGYYKWFQEGVTEYYGVLTLLREGLIDTEAFVDELNEWIIEYEENPVAFVATADTLEARYWSSRHHQRLPYVKGALIAWLVDVSLHVASGGDRSVDDWIRAVIDRATPRDVERVYDLETLMTALTDAGAAADLVELVRDLATTAARVPLLHVAGAIDLLPETRTVFELGFGVDGALTTGSVVGEVVEGSAAANAGVRRGDVIDGIDLWHGDATKDAEFRMLRGDRHVEVRYRPAARRDVTLVDASPRTHAAIEALARTDRH